MPAQVPFPIHRAGGRRFRCSFFMKTDCTARWLCPCASGSPCGFSVATRTNSQVFGDTQKAPFPTACGDKQLGCRKLGFKRGGLSKKSRKNACFLLVLHFQGALRTLWTRVKKAEKGRFPGRAARHTLNPHSLHPHLRQPKASRPEVEV